MQDRHAAPAVTRALQDLAACPEVEVVIVARGGGSLADLFAFCDETLCRTVALLRVPVIASVGHHTDRTLIDDVAAVSCSTPTHAAEAAVPVDCHAARAELHELAARLDRQGRRAIVQRARTLTALSRAPAQHVARHRARLHQQARELRASTARGLATRERRLGDDARRMERRAGAVVAATARGATRVDADAKALDRAAAAARAQRADGARAPPDRARRARPAADARARLRAGGGPRRRAGHERRGRAGRAVAHAPPRRRRPARPPRPDPPSRRRRPAASSPAGAGPLQTGAVLTWPYRHRR